MRGLVVFAFLIASIIVCVLSEDDRPAEVSETSELAVRTDQLVHSRSKRSPHEPILPAILLGKSFLIGALVGKSLRGRGWGWRPRIRITRPGWGWKPAPVVVHHSHSHGGWGGWGGWGSEVVSHHDDHHGHHGGYY